MTRWFRAGAFGLLVVSVLHTVGYFNRTLQDPAALALDSAMDAYHYHILGLHPSASDIAASLGLAMSILLFLIGVLDLVVSTALTHDLRALRRAAWVNVFGAGVLAAMFGYYRILPPCITLAMVMLLFLAATTRPASRRF